ncbi:TPA: hypothetical protein MH381_27240, partial [Klebsiella pneumoniae]|nr:hypothetical protein [Klebsiella pneumoniae]
LIPRLTLSSGKAVRSKLDCMHEPPVQSDRCALSGNYQLESNPERHDKAPRQQPLVTDLEEIVLKLCAG